MSNFPSTTSTIIKESVLSKLYYRIIDLYIESSTPYKTTTFDPTIAFSNDLSSHVAIPPLILNSYIVDNMTVGTINIMMRSDINVIYLNNIKFITSIPFRNKPFIKFTLNSQSTTDDPTRNKLYNDSVTLLSSLDYKTENFTEIRDRDKQNETIEINNSDTYNIIKISNSNNTTVNITTGAPVMIVSFNSDDIIINYTPLSSQMYMYIITSAIILIIIYIIYRLLMW